MSVPVNKISAVTAEAQLDTLFDYYDIQLDDVVNKQARDGLESSRTKLVRMVQKGRLIIEEKDGDLKITQHLAKPMAADAKTIEYGEVCGDAKVAMGTKKEGDNYGQIYALLGSISGLGETAIRKLRGVDLSVAECLGAIFLQV